MTQAPDPLNGLARRAAVFAGAATALLGLVNHVPVRVACLRGAAAWLGALFLCGVFRVLVQHSLQADRARRQGGRA